jgi:hypothetical protein
VHKVELLLGPILEFPNSEDFGKDFGGHFLAVGIPVLMILDFAVSVVAVCSVNQ